MCALATWREPRYLNSFGVAHLKVEKFEFVTSSEFQQHDWFISVQGPVETKRPEPQIVKNVITLQNHIKFPGSFWAFPNSLSMKIAMLAAKESWTFIHL